MLGKLLKHEWKMTWKVPSLLSLFVVLVTIICLFSYQFIGIDNIHDESSAFLYSYMIIMVFLFNLMVISSASIIILVYFSYRFYKSMFTSEGYLTNTLPVKPSELIISKLLCAAFWSIIVTLLSLVGMVLMVFSTIDSIIVATGTGTMADFFHDLSEAAPRMIALFENYTGVNFSVGVTLAILIPILGCFSGVLLPYLCLSLGQLCKKHRVAAAVGYYFGSFVIIQIVTSLISLPFTIQKIFTLNLQAKGVESAISSFFTAFPSYFISLIIYLVTTIIAYCVTRYIVAKKLNLE